MILMKICFLIVSFFYISTFNALYAKENYSEVNTTINKDANPKDAHNELEKKKADSEKTDSTLKLGNEELSTPTDTSSTSSTSSSTSDETVNDHKSNNQTNAETESNNTESPQTKPDQTEATYTENNTSSDNVSNQQNVEIVESIPEAPIPKGDLVSKGNGLYFKGYVRGEYKYHLLNLKYHFDDLLKDWTPRGSPFLAYKMIPPAKHDSYFEVNFEMGWNKFDFFTLYTDTSFVYNTVEPIESVFESFQDLGISMGKATEGMVFPSSVYIPGAAGGFLSSVDSYTASELEKIQINELYARLEIPNWLSVVFGKRRISWNSAFTWTPLDIINPPKNPLEPTLQREGSYNATVDFIHFETFSLTGYYSPSVGKNARGIPNSLDFRKNLYAARLYLNLFDSDVNLATYYSKDHKKIDESGRYYFGFSFSRYFDVIEAHAEALFQQGRPTWLARKHTASVSNSYEPLYDVGQFDYQACRAEKNCKFYPHIVVGARYTFNDNSFLSLEYFYHGTGMNKNEFNTFMDFTEYMEQEIPRIPPTLAAIGQTFNDTDTNMINDAWSNTLTNTPFAYQEINNLRKNYISLLFFKSKMFDILEPKLTAIWNLDDMSANIFPSIEFTLSPNATGRGVVKMLAGVMAVLGGEKDQSSLFPSRFTANLRMTASF